MRPARSLLWAVVAALVAAEAQAAAATPILASAAPDFEAFGAASFLLTALAPSGSPPWLQFQQWVMHNYERAPALMLGLSVLLAVPPLALAGLFVRRKRRSPEATLKLPRKARNAAATASTKTQTEISPWPTEAWVEAAGIPGGRQVIGRTLLRIGREEDNDIRFALKTVHRYHAVIRRTTDGVVMITDVSGKDGNGVLVNGTRVAEARLKKGDVINLGEVKMRFEARPV